MENVSNGENEKSLEILGAEALAELDDETRTQAVTFIASYLNRIYGNCIWVGVLYLARMFSKSDKKRGDNQFDLFEFIADVIQLFAFLFFPLQNLHYWGILKETYQETRIGEVINFGRAHKVAIVYTASFFLAVGICGVMFLLNAIGVNDLEEDNRTLHEKQAEEANERSYLWLHIENEGFQIPVDNEGNYLNYDTFKNYAKQGYIDPKTGKRTALGEEVFGKAPEPIKKDIASGEDTLAVWFWRIAKYSFCFSVAVLLWSFFVAYANRSAFKKIVECYGDEELIDIVEEQYSIRNALFTRETLLSKLR